MTETDLQERGARLAEIKDEINELLEEAWQLVRGTSEEGRAKGYWMAHIRTALDDEHDYLGRSMCTMQETAEALAGEDRP